MTVAQISKLQLPTSGPSISFITDNAGYVRQANKLFTIDLVKLKITQELTLPHAYMANAALLRGRIYYEFHTVLIRINLATQRLEEFPLPGDIRPKAFVDCTNIFVVQANEKLFGFDAENLQMFEICDFVRCSKLMQFSMNEIATIVDNELSVINTQTHELTQDEMELKNAFTYKLNDEECIQVFDHIEADEVIYKSKSSYKVSQPAFIDDKMFVVDIKGLLEVLQSPMFRAIYECHTNLKFFRKLKAVGETNVEGLGKQLSILTTYVDAARSRITKDGPERARSDLVNQIKNQFQELQTHNDDYEVRIKELETKLAAKDKELQDALKVQIKEVMKIEDPKIPVLKQGDPNYDINLELTKIIAEKDQTIERLKKMLPSGVQEAFDVIVLNSQKAALLSVKEKIKLFSGTKK